MTARTEYMRAYNAARREKQKAYYRAHPEPARRRYQANREKLDARSRAWRAANPEKVRARWRAYNAAHPEQIRDSYLRSFYSITVADYEIMLAAQGGVCAICRKPETVKEPKTGVVRRLHVDHDHRCCPGEKSCGRCVRGLLCGACNQGGGKFGDDPALLRAAADYFERPA